MSGKRRRAFSADQKVASPLSPICGKIWAPLGVQPVLTEVFSRNSQTGLGMISMSPVRRQLQFHFTIFSGSMKTEDTILWLTQLHHYHQGKKVLIVWDSLSWTPL